MSKKSRHDNRVKKQKEKYKTPNYMFDMRKYAFEVYNRRLNESFNSVYDEALVKNRIKMVKLPIPK